MKEEIFLDTYSLRLLAELQRDARQTVQQLAQRVGLSATPCWKRIKDMEAAGVIRGYSVLVDREKLGLRQLAVVEVNLERHTEELVQQFERAVAATPQIVRCLSTTPIKAALSSTTISTRIPRAWRPGPGPCQGLGR